MKKKNYCLLLLLSVFPLLLKSQFLAADINKSLVGSDPSFVRAEIEYFVFTALSDQYGRELFVSDGTEAGTKLVKDIRIGTQGSLPSSFKSFNNTLYFLAQDGAVGTELWKSDGTAQGTQLVKDIFTGPGSAFGNNRLQSTSDGIHFYFVAKDSLQGWALWRSDGTLTGTNRVYSILPTVNATEITELISHKRSIFFKTQDGLNGQELWKTNGTPEGTALVADIRPFDQSPNVYYFHVGMMTNVNETLFFPADNGTLGGELWKTDGTTQGTQLVKDIWPGIVGSSPGNGISFKNNLYFNASDGVHGTELWRSDGTVNGTVLVKDILPGEVGALPINFVVHNNELYFVVANDGEERYALWKTDGTSEGTVRVKRIAANDNKSYIRPPFSWGKYLYFSSDDDIHGYELWRSNGTEEGTVMLFDLNKGPASSEPDNFTPYKNDLYFSADDGIHGQELWRLNASTTVSTTETTISELLIFPNPATDKLTIRNTVENQALYISLFDSNGKMVINRYLLRDSTKDFDVHNLSAGLYVLEMSEETSGKRHSKKIVIVR